MYRSGSDYLPAEWEHQDGVLLTWPRRGGDWSPLWDDATAHFSELAALICRSQRLIVVCPDVEEIPGIRHNLLARG
jgi:agmatine/peptidylarginine deiminase